MRYDDGIPEIHPRQHRKLMMRRAIARVALLLEQDAVVRRRWTREGTRQRRTFEEIRAKNRRLALQERADTKRGRQRKPIVWGGVWYASATEVIAQTGWSRPWIYHGLRVGKLDGKPIVYASAAENAA